MLVERGLKVDAVEPGEHLAAVARRRVGARSVQFHLGRFEDVTLPPESFEAVFSATAFHWVDPAVGWLKVARVLAPSGVFALLQASLPGLSEDELTAWRAVLPDAATWMPRDSYVRWSGATERMSNISELWTWLVKKELARPEAAELFTEPRLLVAPVAYEHTAAEYIALLRTTSTYQRLEPPLRPALEARIEAMIAAGGGVHQAVETATLVTACRATVAPAGVLG